MKGLEFLDELYQAILKRVCLKLTYQSFNARKATSFTFHPYILKEFNNRWFLIGRRESETQILTLALDRIKEIDYDFSIRYKNDGFDGDNYYANTIGVTVLGKASLYEVRLRVNKQNAPYVLTKPFHWSQKMLSRSADGSVLISLYVHLNLELDRMILGFGDAIEVESPKVLKNRIKRKLERAFQQYY